MSAAARTPTIAPFPTDPVLLGVMLAYRNARLIADQALPRVPVGAREYRYMQFSKADAFTLPKTRVGRRSKVNATEFGGTEQTGTCQWDALDAEVPNDDISAAPPGFDPVANGVMLNTELIALAREKRVADLVFSADSYPVGNKVALSTNDRWTDEDSDPIGQIEDGRDAMILSPNTLVLGRVSWKALKLHPAIVAATNRNEGTKGVARLQDVAELFEVERILVGEGWLNTAKPGQAPNMVRVWGEHASLLHINPNANNQGGMTFGFTAQFGGPIAGRKNDDSIGATGGVRARTGECTDEKIIAGDLGYFFQNAGAAG